MSSKEVITLQIGNYSNHVGTHFWNLQYDMLRYKNGENTNEKTVCKLFRETADRHQPYVPRMITFDDKSNLNALKLDGSFGVQEQLKDSTVENNIDVDDEYITYMQTENEKNDFLLHFHSKSPIKQRKDFHLDEKVKTWSDYMSYNLNENSLQMLTNRFEEGSKFLYHGMGHSEYRKIQDDTEDKLHYWIEECNSLDGFMIFTDIHDGYCGLTSKVLEELQDDYKCKTFLPFTNCLLSEESAPDENAFHWLNIGLTIQSFQRYSSMFVMQSLKNNLNFKSSQDILIPNISYKADLPYHTSAILASAINSAILPWRQYNQCDILDMCQHITQDKWKLCGNAIGFPFAKDPNDITLFERIASEKEFYDGILTSLFPLGLHPLAKPMTQSLVLQDRCGLIVPKFEPKILQSLGLNFNVFQSNPEKVLAFFTEHWYPSRNTLSNTLYAKENLDFSNPILSMLETSNDSGTAVMSSLFTSATFHDTLFELITNIQRLNLNKLHLLQGYGFDDETHKELLEDLFNLAEEYNLHDPYKEIYDPS